jgi:hypothetical protein
MNRRTIGDLKEELLRVAGVSGFPAVDKNFYTQLDKAVSELMNEGDFPGIVDRYNFRINGGYIVLPGDLNRLMAVAVNNEPIELRSPWFEFAASGPGVQDPKGWTDVVLERGEVATFEMIPAAEYGYDVIVRGEVDERVQTVRPVIILQGYGDDGQWIRSDYNGERIDGVAVSINGDSGSKETLATVKFRQVTGVIKPETKGYVDLLIQYRGAGLKSLIARYAPRETTPSYRRYYIPSLSSGAVHSVQARCRARFVPHKSTRDFLLITNMNALEVMFRALQKRDNDNFDDYLKYKAVAVSILKKEAAAYQQDTPKPAMTQAPARSIGGAIPHLV